METGDRQVHSFVSFNGLLPVLLLNNLQKDTCLPRRDAAFFLCPASLRAAMKRNQQWDVSGATALAGVFHFLHSCAGACLLPFLTLYLRQLGLTAAMVGIVMGTKHLIAMVWRPLSSFLAWHYGQRRSVVMASLLCAAGASLILLLIPPGTASQRCNTTCLGAGLPGRPPEDAVHLSHPHPGTSASPTVPVSLSPASRTTSALMLNNTSADPLSRSGAETHISNQSSSESQISESTQLDVPASTGITKEVGSVSGRNISLTSSPERKGRSLESKLEAEPEGAGRYEFLGSLKDMGGPQQCFLLVLMAVALWEVLAAPLEWAVDDGLFEYLDFVNATDWYGSTHMWGLLGAAGGACGAGLLVSSLQCLIGDCLPRSSAHFFSYALLKGLAIPVAVFLPMYLSRKREPVGRALKALRLAWSNGQAMLCAATAFLGGAAISGVDDFLLWQMHDHGSSELHMGVALAVALLSHALFHLLSSQVARVMSRSAMLSMGTTCLGLQCLCYSFVWSPWSFLPIQVLSGLSSAALWWAVQEQCEGIAKPGMERDVHRVFCALTVELGVVLGSFTGGLVVEHFGTAVLFRASAAALLPWALLIPLVHSRIPHQRKINYSQLLAADASEVSDSESDQERDWLVKAMQDDRSNNDW
ncbi:hypothetical protein MATL_G00209620 [Megalops atlanticus]|uniref:Major facilitator superfamily associated domain-containing protein n=1 Tax=Megalops atlanticus TaxID=7932 RepID=A0A9D3SZ16_MEGAT|nr:hypothetical protein MATL_G00209620 [Megalops atlanticus]